MGRGRDGRPATERFLQKRSFYLISAPLEIKSSAMGVLPLSAASMSNVQENLFERLASTPLSSAARTAIRSPFLISLCTSSKRHGSDQL